MVTALSPGDNRMLGMPTPSRPVNEQQLARRGLRVQFSGSTMSNTRLNAYEDLTSR